MTLPAKIFLPGGKALLTASIGSGGKVIINAEECCCGCVDCDSATMDTSYLATFPGSFTNSMCAFYPLGGASDTTFALDPISGFSQCFHGNDGVLFGDVIIDSKAVWSIVLYWANTPCDSPGDCPRWVFQITFFRDEDGSAFTDGPVYYYSPDTSDPADPTGTYSLVCASCDGVIPLDPGDYTAPATITIS